MADGSPSILNEEDAVERIYQTIRRAPPGSAPFALVLGAGFSHGLVSTAQQLVTRSLPLWMKALEDGEPYEALESRTGSDEAATVAASFWQRFTQANHKFGLRLALGPKGLPEDQASAYQAVFDPKYDGAVGSPSDARTFQRALMRLDEPRLNAAHFLLASILGVQPTRSRQSTLFNCRAAFTRLILTTNFDPFLQTALQSVNRLYFMSDTPDLGLGDEILDDHADAVHLVYVHGSIHRRSQKATTGEIRDIKAKNARILAPVLKRHGVIVLGYSGWDDAIVDALAACESFDHRLYWCGMSADPTAKGAFGDHVAEVLGRPSASYVQIGSAGRFMARLCTKLVRGLPRLLDNPVGQIREMLEIIDLKELETQGPVTAMADKRYTPGSAPEGGTFGQAQRSAIALLRQAEALFVRPPEAKAQPAPAPGRTPPVAAAEAAPRPDEPEREIERLLSSAKVAHALGNLGEVLRSIDEALRLARPGTAHRAEVLLLKGRTLYDQGKGAEATAQWSQVIEAHPQATVEQRAKALYNRGMALGYEGSFDQAIRDYDEIVDRLPGAPMEQLAKALFARGWTRDQKGEAARSLGDYDRLIALDGAPVEQVAQALYNRAWLHGEAGRVDAELADLSRIIDGLPGAPAEQVASALLARASAWEKRGQRDRELADYDRVVDGLADVPPDELARALINRALTRSQRQATDQNLADFNRVIDALPGAPSEQVARALVSRGQLWAARGDLDRALADHGLVIEGPAQFPKDLVALALGSRTWLWRQKGDEQRARADRELLTTMVGAETGRYLGMALGEQGWKQYLEGDDAAFLRSTEAALAEDPTLDYAAFNLGLALLANGRDPEAREAYERAARRFPAKIANLGRFDLEQATRTWLPPERARPILELLEAIGKDLAGATPRSS